MAKNANGSTRNLVRTLSAPGRRAGTLYLSEYEKAVERSTRVQKKLAGAVPGEELRLLVRDQLDLGEAMAKNYVGTMRKALS